MSEEHDSDLATNIPTEKLEEYDVENTVETATSVVDNPKRVLLPLLGGGALLLSALRSLTRGQFRAIPKGVVGAGLLGYGLRNRRSSESPTFEPSTVELEEGTDGKETSDEASAAAERTDSGRESQIDADGEIDESAQLGEEGETGSRIEFTDDAEEEPRTKPEHAGDEEDPRRNSGDDDEPVEVDVSDTAMAEEVAEATGPDPEQAQPSQTDATEPEETPEEDASDMKVEPDEDADSTTDEADADADEGTEPEADAGEDDEQ